MKHYPNLVRARTREHHGYERDHYYFKCGCHFECPWDARDSNAYYMCKAHANVAKEEAWERVGKTGK